MKIVIISEYNHFTTIGGTEYYVNILLDGLSATNEVILIAKGKDKENTSHFIENSSTGKTYEVFLLPDMYFDSREVQQKLVSKSWNFIFPILQEVKPDIIHVHTSTTFFNIRHFELCAQYFFKLFFTTHIPGHFCAKGDLIQNNTKPCDGVIGLKCYVCMFTKSLKHGFSNLMFQYSDKKLEELKTMHKMGINIICPSRWQKNQLIANGYPAKDITVIRQAIQKNDYTPSLIEKDTEKFRIGYLGRLSPEKGSALLFKLIRSCLNNNNLKFILGIPPNSNEEDLIELKKIIDEKSGDLVWLPSINKNNKEDFFNEIDCLIITSHFIETGPIVLLEASLYGKPVIAPNVGGPQEFANDFDNVHLYKWNDLNSIKQTIENLKIPVENNNFKQKIKVLDDYSDSFLCKHIDLYKNSI